MRSHGNRLLVGVVGTVPGPVRGYGMIAGRVRDEVERYLGTEFFENAPFDEIGVILRCGPRTCLRPQYRRIATRDGLRELPIAVELEMRALHSFDEQAAEQSFR